MLIFYLGNGNIIYDTIDENKIYTPSQNQIKETDIFEAARLGETISFCGLIECQEADLKAVDNVGNTILHVLILISGAKCRDHTGEKLIWKEKIILMMKSWYSNCSEWLEVYHTAEAKECDDTHASALKKLMAIENNAGLTPLNLASLEGADYVVKCIISQTPYCFKPESIDFKHKSGEVAYVMNEIDNILTLNGKSAFEYVLRRPPYEAGRILRIQPFDMLLKDKWSMHKKWRVPWFLWHLSIMTIFTLTCVYRPINKNSVHEKFDSWDDHLRFVGEIFLVLSFCGFVYGELVDFWHSTWRRYLYPADKYVFLQLTNRTLFVFVLITLILRWCNNKREDVFIALSLLLGWTKSIQYLAFWRHMGMFPFVMHKILIEDVLQKFLVAFIMILIGISTAIYCTFQRYKVDASLLTDNTHTEIDTFDTLFSTVFLLIEVTFGMGEIETFETRNLSIFMFLAFLYLVNLVMMNMLIAMLSDTYSRTRVVMDKNWNWVEGILALLIESHMPSYFKIKYEQLDKHSLENTLLQYTMWRRKSKIKPGNEEDLHSSSTSIDGKKLNYDDRQSASTHSVEMIYVAIVPKYRKIDKRQTAIQRLSDNLSKSFKREWWTL